MKSKFAAVLLAAASLAAALLVGSPVAANAADKPLIGLTFDDGPSVQRTAFVLDVLHSSTPTSSAGSRPRDT